MDAQSIAKILKLKKDIQSGLFGKEAIFEQNNFEKQNDPISYYLSFISDLFTPPDNDKELYQIGMNISTYLLILYRDTKLKNERIADCLYNSLFYDFPRTFNTSLFDKFRTLIENSIAFKKSIPIEDRLVLWETSKLLFLAYNEFINGLLGFICICARVSIGKQYDVSIIRGSYKRKIDDFKKLNLHFVFPEFDNLIQREIRNAIGHSSLSFVNENDEIDYYDAGGRIQKISLIKFIGYESASTYLPVGYICAIMTIYIIKNGTSSDRSLLPASMKQIFKIDNF